VSQLDALRLVDMTRQRVVDLSVSENYLRDASLSEAAAAWGFRTIVITDSGGS
jgi:hypothetical protein